MKNAKALMLASLLSVSGLVLVGCGSSCGSKGCKVETKTEEVVVAKEVEAEQAATLEEEAAVAASTVEEVAAEAEVDTKG
ncbi:MAG: hypothetical protein P4L31_03655 [Candidatus Babeliales bacterium]|nr:hypothetical protein [Candidatus Babeliales bacterium]